MKIALIGLGMVAPTHVAAIRDAGFSLAGVMGRDPDRAAAFARSCGARVFDTADDIATDASVDFAIIATPPDARSPIVEALCATHKPILMEKPLERSAQAAKTLVALCETTRTPLGVVFQHRARTASRALKRMIEEGQLGDIATVELRVPWWRDQAYYDAPGRGTYARDGGGVMISQAIHTLDLAIWLAGPVRRLQSLMRTTPLHRLEAEDWAGALMEFSSGAVGTLMASTTAFPGDAESITINGTAGSAHLQSGTLTVKWQDGRTETHGQPATTGGGADPMAFTHVWHQRVIEDFAQSLANNRPPMVTGAEALQVHAVIDAMQTANRTGQKTEVQNP